MLPEALEVTMIEFGLTGLALIVVYKVLDVVKMLYLNRRGMSNDTALLCQQDPIHFQRIREIHKSVTAMDEKIAQGALSCQWKDRDEVRDYLELQRKQITASEATTVALRELAAELRRTRMSNGPSSI